LRIAYLHKTIEAQKVADIAFLALLPSYQSADSNSHNRHVLQKAMQAKKLFDIAFLASLPKYQCADSHSHDGPIIQKVIIVSSALNFLNAGQKRCSGMLRDRPVLTVFQPDARAMMTIRCSTTFRRVEAATHLQLWQLRRTSRFPTASRCRPAHSMAADSFSAFLRPSPFHGRIRSRGSMRHILPPFLRTLPRLRITVHAKAQQIITLIEDLPCISDIEVSLGRREPSPSLHVVRH
jgi:hypothetical protein